MRKSAIPLTLARSGVFVWALSALMPMVLVGQEDPVARLSELLPPDVAERVVPRVEAAQADALPAHAMASLALEGVAKGRSADEVLSAVEAMGLDLVRARDALASSGRAPVEGDVEAAAAALRMGADPHMIAELARTQPSGRSLAVPMMVMGGLFQAGHPSMDALTAVQERLAAGIDDPGLLRELPEFAQGQGRGMRPADVGPAHAAGHAGFPVPVAGIAGPMGPRRGPPDGLPGRVPPKRPAGS